MARPKRNPDAPNTRDRIMAAARIEFAAQGIAAPLDAIAQRCGIRRPSLLHHFPSKQALIIAVTDDVLSKARERLLAVINAGVSNQRETMRQIVAVLRELEDEEQGVAGVLLHGMLSEDEDGAVTQRIAQFIDVIQSSALAAGAGRDHPNNEMRAAIAHLVIGELTRVALGGKADGSRADLVWGAEDGVDPLYKAYFLDTEQKPQETK